MSSRTYSSYLLRFWLANNSDGQYDNSPGLGNMVLQLQHLQTGATYRLNNLSELSELLSKIMEEGGKNLLQERTGTDLNI
ncbi:MAG TPA: hypothetical protein VH186_27725 [Chloroflexia bacterium]|nr:hypothetical protein [Chloroflexia bacterium]